MQPVTKIIYQIKVCSSFIKTPKKCKCVINEEIVEIATVIVIKKVYLYKQKALSSEITTSSIIVMIIEAKMQWSNFTKPFNWFVKYEHV